MAMTVATAWGCGETQTGSASRDAAPDVTFPDADRVDARTGHDTGLPDAVSRRDGRGADGGVRDASSDTTLNDAISPDAEAGPDGTDQDGGQHADGCSSGVTGVSCLATSGPAYQYGFIAVDQNNIYAVEETDPLTSSVIVRIPRAGGATVTLTTAFPDLPMASDGTNLYWGEHGVDGGAIVQVPVIGGIATTLAPATYPQCLTFDDTNVYWTDVDAAGYALVVTVSKEGGLPTTLATGTDRFQYNLPIAVDSTSVYWVDSSVLKIAKAGGSVVTVASAATQTSGFFYEGCRLFALSGESLFVTGSPIGAMGSLDIQNVPTAGTTSPTVIASGDSPQLLASGATNLFWVGVGTQIDVNETPPDGGTTTVLTSPLTPYVGDMVVASDGTLYWTTNVQVQSFKP